MSHPQHSGTAVAGARRLGAVAGVAVEVTRPVWLVVAVASAGLALLLADPLGGPTGAVAALSAAALLLASVTLHHLARAFAAREAGQGQHVTVSLGGITVAAVEPATPREAAAAAALGPVTSLVLASVWGMIAAAAEPVRPIAYVAGYLGWANLVLAGLSVGPVRPLEGGRLLHAALWRGTGDQRRAARWTAYLGRACGTAALVVGMWWLLTGGADIELGQVVVGTVLLWAAISGRWEAAVVAPPSPARLRLRRAYLPACLVLLLGAAFAVPFPRFVERPGSTFSLAERVAVAEPGVTPLTGDFLFTTIRLEPATPVRLLRAAVDRAERTLPRERFARSGERNVEYFARQRHVFADTADVAVAVGADAAGFPVDFEDRVGSGVLITGVRDGAAVSGVLYAGDVITAVDDTPVTDVEGLRAAIDAGGGEVVVAFRRHSLLRTATVRPATVDGVRMLGVVVTAAPGDLRLPVAVAVDGGRVGGPSAGLLIALAVYDLLHPGDLAAGRRIAGTGTIDTDGTVGTIAGVRAKARAAAADGVEVFLAPAAQAAAAREALDPSATMVVHGVDTFAEAVAVLGGSLDRP